MPNYYEILGLSREASREGIDRRYRELCLRYHPDRNEKGAEKFKLVQQAYEILRDPERRRAYDLWLSQRAPRTSPSAEAGSGHADQRAGNQRREGATGFDGHKAFESDGEDDMIELDDRVHFDRGPTISLRELEYRKKKRLLTFFTVVDSIIAGVALLVSAFMALATLGMAVESGGHLGEEFVIASFLCIACLGIGLVGLTAAIGLMNRTGWGYGAHVATAIMLVLGGGAIPVLYLVFSVTPAFRKWYFAEAR
jgi:hypothetical protein